MPKKKIGRPTDSPKKGSFRMRMDEETDRKLRKCSEILDETLSDTVRKSIHRLYNDLTK